jgi:hypothetical protein
MGRHSVHLSDRDLLLAADRELAPRRRHRQRADAERHLAECAMCRARLRETERALAAATDGCADLSMPVPSAAVARARLQTELTRLSLHHAPSPHLARWAMACAAMLAATIGLAWLLAVRPALDEPGTSVRGSAVWLLPRGDLTPGMARPVTVAEVCGDDRQPRTRPIPMTVRDGVFERYGADVDRSSEYELDYLITPELGGTPDPGNLWPQPFSGTAWNAYVKDELELHLHQLVCAGAIDVATAQREIATDWIATYRRRFQTETPLRDYAASPLTEHDGDLLRAELAELGIPPPSHRADGPALMALLQRARAGSPPRW